MHIFQTDTYGDNHVTPAGVILTNFIYLDIWEFEFTLTNIPEFNVQLLKFTCINN